MLQIPLPHRAGLQDERFTFALLDKSWRQKIAGNGKQPVELTDPLGPVARVEVMDLWVGPLVHAPAVFVERYHDPAGRLWSGLHLCLQCQTGENIAPGQEIVLVHVARCEEQGNIHLPTAGETAAILKPESFGGND